MLLLYIIFCYGSKVPSAVVVWRGISQTISLSFPWGFVSVNMRKMNIVKANATVGEL